MILIEYLKLLRINTKIIACKHNFLINYIALINSFIIDCEVNFFKNSTEIEETIINEIIQNQASFSSNEEVIKIIKSKSYSLGENVEFLFNKFVEKQFILLPENKSFVDFLLKNSSTILILIPNNPNFDDVKNFLLKFYLKYNDLSRESKEQLYLVYPNIIQLIKNKKFKLLIIKFIQLSD